MVMFEARPPLAKGRTRCTRPVRKEVDAKCPLEASPGVHSPGCTEECGSRTRVWPRLRELSAEKGPRVMKEIHFFGLRSSECGVGMIK